MTRPKTISDEELLAVARKVFREKGNTASTRAIASQAGISEAVLYQRFGSKEDLFFAAMSPRALDLESLLGPERPTEPAPVFVRNVVIRMAQEFAEVIPLALEIVMHPKGRRPSWQRAQPGLAHLREGLVTRLAWFEARKVIRPSTAERTAQLLIGLAHDWAIGITGHNPAAKQGTHDLAEMADIVWKGIAR